MPVIIPAAGRLAVVHAVGGERRDLEERRARVEQRRRPARAAAACRARRGARATWRRRRARSRAARARRSSTWTLQRGGVAPELVGARVDARLQRGHGCRRCCLSEREAATVAVARSALPRDQGRHGRMIRVRSLKPTTTVLPGAHARMSGRPAGATELSGTAFATLLLIALMMGANHVAARIAFDNGVDVATAVAFRSSVTALVVGVLLVAAARAGRAHAAAKPRAAGDRPADRRAEPVPVFGGGPAAGGPGAAGLQHLPALDRAVGAPALRHRPERACCWRCR